MKNDLPAGIEEFLTRYGRALVAGDLDEIVHCWAIPSMVVSDQGAITVTNGRQVRDFFQKAITSYRSSGIVHTRHWLEHCEDISNSLVSVDVTWLALDANDDDRFTESARYILASCPGGFQIRAAIIKTPAEVWV